jgi:hypothetical protein
MVVSGQLRTPAALPLGNSPRCPLCSGLDRPQSQSGHYGEETHLLTLWEFNSVSSVFESRESVVGIATGYGLEDRGIGI